MPKPLFHALLGGSAGLALLAQPALAVDITVPGGTTESDKIELTGNDTLTVDASGAVSTSKSESVKIDGNAPGVIITNNGVIENTDSGNRAIRAETGGVTHNYTLNNGSDGVISAPDDAFQIHGDVTNGTIIVRNDGLIQSSNDGQAIDFADIVTGDSTTIVNAATGEIRAADADAVRPGERAVVENFGLIEAGATPGNTGNDGVDLRGSTRSRVINRGGATIIGAHQGVNGSGTLRVVNNLNGTIIGRNGSGVGSDGTGIVVNRGTIRGEYTPSLDINGDGDGVDIDGRAVVENWGEIIGAGSGGVDSGGNPNNAEGLPIGGGLVNNYKGALVRGAQRAMLVDDGSGGPGVDATEVNNLGTMEGLDGFGIKFVGPYDDTIRNGGLIRGTNGEAVLMGDGDDTFVMLPGGSVEGIVDGEGGTNTFRLGALAELNGIGRFGDTISPQNRAMGIFDLGELGTTYRGFSGDLSVDGRWTITGSSDFSDNIDVQRRANVYLNGAFPNAGVSVGPGTVGGNGTIHRLFLESDSTLMPGAPYGALTVLEEVQFRDLSADPLKGITADPMRFVTNVNAEGQSGYLDALYTNEIPVELSVVAAESNDYPLESRYPIVMIEEGLHWTFLNDGDVPVNLDFLDADVVYDTYSAWLILSRTDETFATIGETHNQTRVGEAVQDGGPGTALYDSFAGEQLSQVRSSLNYLSGDIFPSQMGALYLQNQSALRFLADRGRDTDRAEFGGEMSSNFGAWAAGYGRFSSISGDGNAADIDDNGIGFMLGAEYRFTEDFKLGLGFGVEDSDFDVDARMASSDALTYRVGGYTRYTLNGMAFGLTGFYGRTNFDTDRVIDIGGTRNRVSSDYFGNSGAARFEGDYLVDAGPVFFQPYGAFNWVGGDLEGFRESGASLGALDTNGYQFDGFSGDFGVRGGGRLDVGGGMSLKAAGSIGLTHNFGDTGPSGMAYFNSTGQSFSTRGVDIDRNTFDVGAGLYLDGLPNTTLGIEYDGNYGSDVTDTVIRGGFRVHF